MLNENFKKILCGCAISLVLMASLALRAKSQQQQTIKQSDSDILEQIEKTGDQPVRVLGNDDCPFKIIEAKVQEVSPTHFSKLTGKNISLSAVSSVPEVTMVNTTGKTITEFIVGVRNPESGTGRALFQKNVAIHPGETYVVKREHFLAPERAAIIGEKAGAHKALAKFSSEQYWIEFAERPDMYVTVGRVIFDDGSVWTIREGGDAK